MRRRRPSCPAGTTGCPCAPGDACNAADDVCVASRCQSRTPGTDGGPPMDAPAEDAPSTEAPDTTTCGDTTSDRTNCGACGHVCRFGDCVDSVCQPGFSAACDPIPDGSPLDCHDLCARHGGTCAPRACRRSITDASALIFGSLGNCEVGFVDTSSTHDCDVPLTERRTCPHAPPCNVYAQCCCE
ncbi:MAG: hypothetical protein KF901_27955 [Myxococcales bacterium]|nr:hypothetical protein [Myxococcales bacterium]